MGGKRTKKKQVQVRTIGTRSSPLPAPSSQSPTHAKDSHGNGVSIHRDLSEESVGDDVVSRASMKGGCGKICRHLERGVNVDKLSCHLAKSKTLLAQCQDCAKDGKTGTNKKSKGRSMRKKLVQTSSFQNGSQQAKKWVCLACGYVGCGAISATPPPHSSEESVERDENGAENANEEGVPTGHAWKHSLLAKHPLALQCGDKLVCWCFFCNIAVEYCFSPAASPDLDNVVEEGKQSVALAPRGTGLLQQAVTLVRDKLLKEAVFFKDPGILDQIDKPGKAGIDEMPNPNSANSSRLIPNGHCSGSQRKRVVKGLMNLGNTCFFNSVMQNLLALDLLRDYFSQDSEVTEGPLTSALRRLYLETNSDGPSSSKAFGHVDMLGLESGTKRGGKGRMAWESTGGAYNPRSLFGAICAKAPRFRGFQQQDSHELLRCLLEGLHSEEQSAKGTEGESKKVTGFANSSALMEGVGGGELESCEEALQHGDAESPTVAQISTLVDNFFGGQLSSTVRCCECGHSSVVYERFLDLSLQIPARQVGKKGQARAGEGPLSFLAERSEKDPSHRDVRSTRDVQKIDLSETSNSPGHVGAKSPKFSLEIFSSASAENKICSSEISSSAPAVQSGSFGAERGDSSQANPIDDDSLHDFGWLDFVGGGIQSAEGSLQGPHDVVGQHSENSLIAYAEDSIQDTALMNVSHTLSFSESGNVQSLNGLKPFEKEGIGESPVTNHSESASISQKDELPPSKCVLDISGVDAHQDVLVDVPISGQDVEPEMSMAELNDEDEPLPLASGVLLLPYECLQVPNSTEVPNCNLDKSSCSLQGEDKGRTSSLLLEQDGGDFDGFSQLFEQDESPPVKDLTGDVRGSVDGSMDASWDVDTETFVEGESDPMTAGLQKLIEHKDAILPMSLEGCLADFTKSELLSGENAWACERCTQRLKENASPLASDNEGNKSVSYSCKKGFSPKRSGGKLGKGRPQIHRKDVPNPTGKDVPSSSKYSNGDVSHADHSLGSVLSCVPNGRVCSASPIEDGSFSESLSLSHASCNGNIEHNSPSFKAGDSNTYKVEATVRIGNGSARLNELDSGQLPGCQSPSFQADNEEITHLAQGDCTKKLGAMAPMEAVCAEQKIETGVGERPRPQNIGKEDNDVDDSQSDQTEELFSAESSGKRHVQKDCTGVDQMNTGTSCSANKEKLPGPFRMSGKPLKLQKIKNRKSQLENERVVKRDATKRLLISKAPPILTIHLKRFAQDMRGRLNKLSGHVAFPEVLDLQPFLDSKCLDLKNCVYRLIGIVEHGGTMRGGHYIAYVRGPLDETNQETDSVDNGNKSSWHFISDSSVRKSTLPAVLNSDAYLLFYQKCMS